LATRQVSKKAPRHFMFVCACLTAESKDGDVEEAQTLTAATDGPLHLSETLSFVPSLSRTSRSSVRVPETEIPETGEAEKISQAPDKAEEASESKDKEDKAPSNENIAEESKHTPSKENTAASSKSKKSSKEPKKSSKERSNSGRSKVKISAKGGFKIDQTVEEFQIGEKLVQSAEAGDLDTIRSLLEQGASVETMDEEGRSVLRTAAKKGHVDLCRVLLVEFAADINGNNPHNGYTPLHWACKFDREETIKLLVSHGASFVQDKDGLFPLDLVQKRNPKIAEWMTSRAAPTSMGA